MLSYPGDLEFFNFFMHFSTSGGVKGRLSDSSLVFFLIFLFKQYFKRVTQLA